MASIAGRVALFAPRNPIALNCVRCLYSLCLTGARSKFAHRRKLLQTGTADDDVAVAVPRVVREVLSTRQRRQYTHNYSTSEFDDQLFHLLSNDEGLVPVSRLLNAIKFSGLWLNDPRLSDTMLRVQRYLPKTTDISITSSDFGLDGDFLLDKESFSDCVQNNATRLIRRAFTGDFVIPEFPKFCSRIGQVYDACRRDIGGKVADYIPQLARFSPDYWGVSLCTVDGQRHSIGDVDVPFTVQSGGKPAAYALAVNELGLDEVHRYVGHEPSGESFNCIKLSQEFKPHNPLINAGAIVVASLIKRNLRMADRMEYVSNQYRRLIGGQGEYLGYNNAIFLSEKETAHRNRALGHYMMENRCFPEGTSLDDTLDLYFRLCSIEVNANSAAVMAATLANGGYCPITGEEVLSATSVRNTLSLMHSCGMYDYSGGFAFKVGLPAKSAVSGMIMLVVPNVMGMCLWSPPLERMGNSVRGVMFAEKLVQEFNFHHYDNLKHTSGDKTNPRVRLADSQADRIVNLLFGAYNGDLTALRLMAVARHDMAASDYDGRTALHLAASEGHLNCVRFLIEKCGVGVGAVDRWGNTPFDDAVRFQRRNVQEYLESRLRRVASA